MPALDLVSDASVVLKWFHAEGEDEVEASRAILAAQRGRTAALVVLDLTTYEVANALLRGRPRASPEQATIVLDALEVICPAVRPNATELEVAAGLAARHGLTFYDAAYAAVARVREATLVTLDASILRAGLGRRPSEVVADLL